MPPAALVTIEPLTHNRRHVRQRGAAPSDTSLSTELDPELALRLSTDAYWHLVHMLRLTLPPPLTDSPEDLLRRDHAAIARIATLVPANAAEADLAAQFVAASEQWKDCLRLAQAPETTPEWAAKCRAQAMAMMRQANGALRLLLRMQQARRKLETDGAAADRLAWREHCAIGLMADALAACSPPGCAGAGPLPEGEGAEKASPLGRGFPRRTPGEGESPLPQGEGRGKGADAPDPDLLAAAERYAATYPERAAAIRRTRRLSHDVVYFDPPEAAVARALITPRTPTLAALDAHPIPPANCVPDGAPLQPCTA